MSTVYFWREWRGSNSQRLGLESSGNAHMPSLPYLVPVAGIEPALPKERMFEIRASAFRQTGVKWWA